MTIVTRNQKIYFAAVGLLALWVGIWGYFIPEHVDKAIPWLIPPLHARFVGALYLSAAFIMVTSMWAKHYDEIRVSMFVSAIWTGSLLIISLFYLNEFDFTRGPVLFWFGAYILYPIIGFWFAWKNRTSSNETNSLRLSNWILKYLLIQGVLLTILAIALLFFPETMINFWPWKITRMLAQIYSGPFLAYAVASLMLSRQRTWSQVRIVAIGLFILSIGVLIASIIHRSLFSASSLSTWIWFAGFSLITLCSASMMVHNINKGVLN